MTDRLSVVKKSAEDVRAEYIRVLQKNKDLEQQLFTLSSRLENCQKIVEVRELKISELESFLFQLETELHGLRQESGKEKILSDFLCGGEITNLRNALSSLESKYRNLKIENNKLNLQIERKDFEFQNKNKRNDQNSDICQKLVDVQTRLNQLAVCMADVKEEKNKIKQKMKSLSEHIKERIDLSVKTWTKISRSQQEQIETQKNTETELRQNISNLKHEITKKDKLINENKKEINQMKSILEKNLQNEFVKSIANEICRLVDILDSASASIPSANINELKLSNFNKLDDNNTQNVSISRPETSNNIYINTSPIPKTEHSEDYNETFMNPFRDDCVQNSPIDNPPVCTDMKVDSEPTSASAGCHTNSKDESVEDEDTWESLLEALQH